jgi:hypothetical protein
MRRLGIVGHCRLAPAASAFVSERSIEVLREFDDVVALSALAVGADTLFAEAAVQLGVPLEIVRPFDRYADDFACRTAGRRYRRLVTAARHETRLPFDVRSRAAYATAMRWIVQRSDVVVAAWDGSPPCGTGGTADAVQYAQAIGRPVVHLDTRRP